MFAASLLMTGCGLYNKYEKTVEDPANVFGIPMDGNSTYAAPSQGEGESSSIAQLSWREFFTDPLLQQLIEQALANNTDLNTARINVEKSEISLRTKKLAYLPSLYFSPQGSISSFDGAEATKSYILPLDVSWNVDVFGSITNKKRAAKKQGTQHVLILSDLHPLSFHKHGIGFPDRLLTGRARCQPF